MQTVVVSMAVLLICLPLFSQGNQGSIQGSVFDQTGGIVAGATVTVIDPARGISRPLTADSAGAYVASSLIPGTYTVRAEAKGFQATEHANVLVEVGQNIRVDLTLQPGAQTQTVTVTSEAPAVDTTDATLGGTVANQTINALPLNGRNFERLVQLRPGVITSVGGSTGSSSTSTNGLRTGSDLLLVDGITSIAQSTGGSLLNQVYRAGDSTSLLPIDAIQEFNTEQNPKAEYGWKAGSVVNLGIKSGTNSLHGTAYAFGRDDAWDANNEFSGHTPLELEQYGATAGGRIIKNKIFWFAGYEGLNWTVGTLSSTTIPSDIPLTAAQDANNQLSMVNACNFLASNGTGGYNSIGTKGPNGSVNGLSAQLSGISIDPVKGCTVSQGSGENLWPYNGTASSTFYPGLLTTSPGNNGIAKGDYHINDHHELSGMFFRGQQDEQAAGVMVARWGTLVPAHTVALDGTWTWTPNSTWVNDFRGGWAYTKYQTLATDANVNPANAYPSGYGINTGVTNPLYGGMPQIQISSFKGYLGSGNKTSVRGPEGEIDFVDHVSYLHGKHAFKFGVEIIDFVFDGDTYNQANGDVVFKTLQTFLSGTPKSGTILVGNPQINVRSHDYAGFFQDDWRVATKLTLNLGLRYSFSAAPTERNNYIGNFYPNVNPATTPAMGQAGGSFPALFNPDYRDFSPRFGLAWDVQGNGKTVVRVGTSILYGLLGAGDVIDTAPFGANFPTVGAFPGVNTSGTAVNIHTPDLLSPSAGQINWTVAGPVFPAAVPTTINGVNYTGITCTPPAFTVAGTNYTGSPCPTIAVSPNYRMSSPTAEYNLDIQRAITNNLTVDVAYVGNYGWNEPSRVDLNQPPMGWGWNGPSSAIPAALGGPLPGGVSPAACLLSNCASAALINTAVTNLEISGSPYYSQFPYLSYIIQMANLYHSSYNGLQITASQRVSHGLSFLAGYTFAHALDEYSSGAWSGLPQDSYNPSTNYGNGTNDIRHRFTLSPTYLIPGIKSPGQMLQGWSVSAIVTAQTGAPWWVQDTTTDLAGTGEVGNTTDGGGAVAYDWNYSGPLNAFATDKAQTIPCFGTMSGCTPYSKTGGVPPAVCVSAAEAPYAGNAQLQQLALAALTNLGCYVRGAGVLTPPAYGTIGNLTRDQLRGPSYYNVDLSIAKDWKFRERYSAQFRAEFFNIFNWADFANPSTVNPESGLGFGQSTATPNNANPVLGSGGPRAIQFGLKLIF